ncbi:MAG: Uma2 family endonuclease, partial [Parafilimonas sp.]
MWIIKIGDDIVVQPDLLIVCEPITKAYLDFSPVLVAEILCPATALKNRHIKYQLYERQQIKYYIIISPDIEEAEIFGNKEKDLYRNAEVLKEEKAGLE